MSLSGWLSTTAGNTLRQKPYCGLTLGSLPQPSQDSWALSVSRCNHAFWALPASYAMHMPQARKKMLPLQESLHAKFASRTLATPAASHVPTLRIEIAAAGLHLNQKLLHCSSWQAMPHYNGPSATCFSTLYSIQRHWEIAVLATAWPPTFFADTGLQLRTSHTDEAYCEGFFKHVVDDNLHLSLSVLGRRQANAGARLGLNIASTWAL